MPRLGERVDWAAVGGRVQVEARRRRRRREREEVVVVFRMMDRLSISCGGEYKYIYIFLIFAAVDFFLDNNSPRSSVERAKLEIGASDTLQQA